MAQYTRNPPLTETELLPDPLAQLGVWLQAAIDIGMQEPTAMTLATADERGRPSARVVLFKGIENGGLSFYTNYEGRKAQEIARNPHVALVFWWDKLERQVRIEGRVDRLPPGKSADYFHSRPRASQLGALASRQSRRVGSRAELEQRLAEITQAHEGREVPLPAFWGGYRVLPEMFEFWQGRRDRLHDRLVYRRHGDGWRIERLEP